MKYKIDKDLQYTNFSGNNLLDITSTLPYSKICQWRNQNRFYFNYRIKSIEPPINVFKTIIFGI